MLISKTTLKLILAILIAFPAVSLSQETGSIRGRVLDAVTSEPLVGANVFVRETQYGAATDLEGRFLIRQVPAGSYRVQASVIGYKSQVAADVMVSPGRETQANFNLQSTAIDLDEVVVEADYFRDNADAPVSAQTLSYE